MRPGPAFVAIGACLLATVATAEEPLEPKPGRGAIEGRVVGYDGEHDLVIEIIGQTRRKKGDHEPAPPAPRIDAEGRFRMPDIRPGLYKFVAMESGVETPRLAKTQVTVEPDKVARVVISFTKQEAGPPVPRFEGSVRFFDGKGDPAVFSFRLLPEEGDAEVVVKGKDGWFRIPRPPLGTYVVRKVVIDGVPHTVRPTPVTFTADEDVEKLRLHVARMETARVLVVDGASGKPVAGARIYRQVGGARLRDGGEWTLPSPTALATTPVTTDPEGLGALRSQKGREHWAVVADGYAWAAFVVVHGQAGELERVALVPGGAVQLRIDRWGELEEAEVELTRPPRIALPEGRRWAVDGAFALAPDAEGEVLVEGLLPGRHVVTVRRKARATAGREYGRVELDVEAGRTKIRVIDARPAARRARVERVPLVLRGTAGWGVELESAHLTGLEPDNSDIEQEVRLEPPDTTGSIAFEAENLVVGRYAVLIEPIGWRGVVEVAPSDDPLELALGAPATLRLRAVAEDTGEEVPATVHWYVDVEGLTSRAFKAAEADPETGTVTIRCAGAKVLFMIHTRGFLRFRETVTLAPGEVRERTVKLVPAGAIRLGFTVDGKPLADPPTPWFELAGPSSSSSFRAGAGGAELAPGTYALTVADIAGYEPVPPRRVRIEARKTLDVTVELVPRE